MSGHSDIDLTVRPEQSSNDSNPMLSSVDNVRNSITAKDYGDIFKNLKDTGFALPKLDIGEGNVAIPASSINPKDWNGGKDFDPGKIEIPPSSLTPKDWNGGKDFDPGKIEIPPSSLTPKDWNGGKDFDPGKIEIPPSSLTPKDWNGGKDFDPGKIEIPPSSINPQDWLGQKDLPGVTQEHTKDADGKEHFVSEFPNGVKVSTTSGGEAKLDNGRHYRLLPSTEIETKEPVHEYPAGSHTFVDKDNKPVYKDNQDGSYEIYTENGVYKAKEDGTVTKELALKGKDGWTVIDIKDITDKMKVDNFPPVDKKYWL